MTMDTEQFIAGLTAEGARRPLPRPFVQILGWLLVMTVWLVDYVGMKGLRPDLAHKMSQPLYLLELLLLLGVAESAAIAAVCLSRPDSCQMPRVRYVPFVFMVFWAVIASFNFAPASAAMKQIMDIRQLDCVSCILLFSLPPGLLMFLMVRRGAVVDTGWAGGMAALSVTAMAYLMMRLVEDNDNPFHLLIWHALPVLALCLLGLAAGRRYLRWR